jgi:DNA polymerase III sliding clamp (beta) subunit (PCNA family)
MPTLKRSSSPRTATTPKPSALSSQSNVQHAGRAEVGADELIEVTGSDESTADVPQELSRELKAAPVTIEEADPPSAMAEDSTNGTDSMDEVEPAPITSVPTAKKEKTKRSKKAAVSNQLKASVKQAELAGALNKLSSLTVSGHDTLQFVQLTATAKALQLTGFNLKTQCSISIEAETEVSGSVLIPPDIDTLQQLEGNLTLDFTEKGLVHSEQGLLQIPIATCKEFPRLKLPEERITYTLNSAALKEASTCMAFADTDVKSAYSGVQLLLFAPFQETNSPKVITPIKGLATNCEVIVRYQSRPQIEGSPEQTFMLPLNACQRIKDILPNDGEVTFTVSTAPNKATVIQVKTGNVEITTQTSANQDADLEAHLPMEQDLNQWNQFKIESSALKGCVARHLATYSGSDKKTRESGLPISFNIDGKEIHTSSSYAETTWHEVIEQENTTQTGESIDILLNLQILQKATSIMPSGSIILEISPDTSTVLISSSSGKVEILTTTMQMT